MEFTELLQRTADVARGAGGLVLAIKKPEVFTKEGHSNFVTEADLASQKYCIGKLSGILPEAHFFAEEQEQNALEPGYNWVIDPIDGTTNFMRGYRHSAVSIGLVKDGEGVLGVVYNPYTEELFAAVRGEGAFLNGAPIQVSQAAMKDALIVFGTSPYDRGKAAETFSVVQKIFLSCGDIRRSGSAALDLCYVAAGRCDGFYEGQLSPWDYAAASVILEEAGGRIGTLEPYRVSFREQQPIVAGNPEVYEEIRRLSSGGRSAGDGLNQ